MDRAHNHVFFHCKMKVEGEEEKEKNRKKETLKRNIRVYLLDACSWWFGMHWMLSVQWWTITRELFHVTVDCNCLRLLGSIVIMMLLQLTICWCCRSLKQKPATTIIIRIRNKTEKTSKNTISRRMGKCFRFVPIFFRVIWNMKNGKIQPFCICCLYCMIKISPFSAVSRCCFFVLFRIGLEYLNAEQQ